MKPAGKGLDEYDWRRFCRQCKNLDLERKCRVKKARMLDDLPRNCEFFDWNGRNPK